MLVISLFIVHPISSIATDASQEILGPSWDELDAFEAIQENEELENTEEFQAFRTAYTTIFYTHEDDLQSFLWKITGDEEIDIYAYPGLAKSRVDRIVEKVQSILDMYPDRFRLKVYVYQTYDNRGPIAYYSHKTHSITTYADVVTDKVFAHEVAHAIIRSYFKILPPKHIREMLSQYVDQHLWRE